jgi:surface protein
LHVSIFANAFHHDLSAWNVSNVTDMSELFQDDYACNNDLSAWNVSNATQMGSVFAGALVFNGIIFRWEDVSPVTNMSWMFQYAKAFNQDLSTWTVSKMTNMEEMFQDASSFHQNLSL